MRHNDAREWVGVGMGVGLLPNSEKSSIFKVRELSWIVNELCTCLIIDNKRSFNISKISKKIAKLLSY